MIDFERYMIAFEAINQKISLLSNLKSSGIKSPENLLNYMDKSFRYKDFTVLQSPETTLKLKTGSCHDQTCFVYEYLKSQLSMQLVDPIFFMELDSNPFSQGGETHSFCLYQTSKNSKFYWFENSAPQWKGITSFKNKLEVKKFILDEHSRGKWGNINKFPNVEFGELCGAPGDTLQEVIDCSLENSVL